MPEPITPLDLTFLLNESRDCPQHVAGVLIFEAPSARSGWTLAGLVQCFRDARPVAPFDRIPEFPLLGRPRWVPMHDFDMRYHVQHVALPAPGTDAQLDELVQQWHSELLDRHRPLFHLTIVEGLAGNRFAIFAKIHHAIVDGVSAIARLLGSLSEDRDAPLLPPLFAVDPGSARPRRAPAGIAKQIAASLDLVRKQATAAGELSGEFWTKLLAHTTGAPSEGSVPFEAPMTPLNVPVRYGRAFAHLSLPLAPLRGAAKPLEGTLNDAVLAIVDDAVARYLAERGSPVRRPLHALVPVSLRDVDALDAGSKVSGVACALGDPGVDVRTRLVQTMTRMNAAKARIASFSKTAATDYFVSLFFIAQGLAAVGIRRPIANFVVSNVPGSKVETYLGGARLLGVYPLNVLTIRLGLSVTLVSRAGQLDFGFTASRSAIADPQRIATLCREAFEALQHPPAAASQAKTKPAKRPVADSRGKRAVRSPRATAPSAKRR